MKLVLVSSWESPSISAIDETTISLKFPLLSIEFTSERLKGMSRSEAEQRMISTHSRTTTLCVCVHFDITYTYTPTHVDGRRERHGPRDT